MGLTPLPPSTCIHLSLTRLRVDVINGWPLVVFIMYMRYSPDVYQFAQIFDLNCRMASTQTTDGQFCSIRCLQQLSIVVTRSLSTLSTLAGLPDVAYVSAN